MSDWYWDWPEWKDPDEWDDVAVARSWERVLGDYLQLGVKRRALQALGDTLRDYYMAPIIAQLNDTTPLLHRIMDWDAAPATYTPPPWHLRKWRMLKSRCISKRMAFGHWVGGTKPHDDDWYD